MATLEMLGDIPFRLWICLTVFVLLGRAIYEMFLAFLVGLATRAGEDFWDRRSE